MKDIVGDYRERFRLQRKALRRYTALLLVLAMITTLFVNWQLHSDGIAATAQYQCNQEEHTHTADCYTKVLVCGYEEGQPEDWNATFDDSASLDESIGVDAEDDGIALFSAEPEYIYVPHEHTDDCYQEVKTLTCLEEEHVHGDDCFDPEDGSLICEQFEHVHDDSCYTTDYELVCGLEDGELVEELNPAYTAVAAFEAPVAAKPVVVSPVIEAPIHYHTDDCYEEVLTCGLEEHHHTVNCLADPLADVEDESEWLAKTSTSLSGDWSADLLTVAQSQLGYTQSEKNFEVDADDGVTVRHYTRYGEWYGNPYGEWDVMFLSYCLNYAGIPQSAIPQRAGVLALRSDLRGAGYLMDPQSIPAAQQDAIALCDEGLPEEESFADADADDLGFADGASSFCSIQPGDIVFYNTTVTETVAVDDTPAVVEDDSPDADIALLSLDPVETEPQTEQRTVTYETVGIVSDVDEDAGTLSVISGNVDGNVAEVPLNASDVTALVSVASAQAVAGDGTDTLEPPYVAYFDEFPDGNGAGITRIDIVIDNSPVNSNMEITSGTTVSLTFHYSVDGSVLEEGEYVLNYKLPNGIAPPEELTRDITYNGHVIGTQVIRTDGTTTLTFNDDCGNYINLNDPFVGKFTLNWKSVTKEGESKTDIIIPGSSDTIITVKDPTGLKVKKEGKIDTTGKKRVHYTVTISSTGWNEPIDIKDTLSGTGVNGIYVKDTFTLKKIDANKNESTLSDTPTITDTGFSYTNLPALVKEETYVLTYDVAYDITSAQGDAQLDNRVQVDEDHRDDASVEFKERIKKSGSDASYSYTKPRQSAALEKGVRKGTNDKITSPSWHKYEKTQTVDKYDPASEQQFSYQLMLDVSSWNSFKDHDTVTITDTLPDGLTYYKDSKSPLFGFRMTDNSGKTVGSISSKITTSVTQEGQTLTFTLSGLSSISDADAAQIQALVIRYTVKVNDSEWTTNPRLESKSYTNTASCDALNLNAKAFVTLNRNVKVLTKKGEQVGKTGNVHYTVVINPTARQLGDGGMVTVTDTLGVCTKNVSAELDYSSIQLYDYPKTNISEPLPTTQYNVSEMSLTGTAEKEPYKTYTFTVDVPNARAFVLEYTINTDASTNVKLKNTVSISGQEDTGSDTTDIGAIDGASTVDQGRLLIHKVDKLNPGTALNGAVFKLERFDSEKGSWEVLNSTALTTKKVDGTDGVIVIPFGNRGDLSVPDKNLFRLTEETAPTGYKKSDEVFYFIWMNTQSDTTITPEAAYQAAVGDKTTDSNGNALPKQPDVTFYGNQKEYSLYVPNERTYLTIQKFWVDEDGRALNGNDVNAESITVNLYSYKKGSDKATASVETITLEKAHKWVYTVTDGIDTDHIYYIEEADSGNLYEVSYNTTVGVTGGGLLTVTNKLTPAGGYELPSTGGAGTTLYTAVGGTMVLAALVCGFCQKRRRERRAD